MRAVGIGPLRTRPRFEGGDSSDSSRIQPGTSMHDLQATLDDPSNRAGRTSTKSFRTRWVIAALGLAVGFFLLCNRDQLTRRLRFQLTGAVQVQGLSLCLDPGDSMITQIILHDGTYEKAQTALLSGFLHPGDTFIDVGANIGWYSLIASRIVGTEGRVVAFEPAPASFELLRRNAVLNHCTNTILEPRALSDKAGELALHLGATNKGHNSILETSETRESVTVPAVELDDYLRNHEGPIALIKIDTEGAEGFVLAGMEQTLRKHPETLIIMEFYPTLIRQAGFDPAGLLARFHEKGYEIKAIDEITGQPVIVAESQVTRLTDMLEKNQKYVNLLVRSAE